MTSETRFMDVAGVLCGLARFGPLILYLAITGLLVVMIAAFLPSMKKTDAVQPS